MLFEVVNELMCCGFDVMIHPREDGVRVILQHEELPEDVASVVLDDRWEEELLCDQLRTMAAQISARLNERNRLGHAATLLGAEQQLKAEGFTCGVVNVEQRADGLSSYTVTVRRGTREAVGTFNVRDDGEPRDWLYKLRSVVLKEEALGGCGCAARIEVSELLAGKPPEEPQETPPMRTVDVSPVWQETWRDRPPLL